MKKISLLLVFVFLLSACSMTVDQLLGRQPAPTPGPTFTNTPTAAPTFTPTVPTSIFTLTPTMVGLKTKTTTPDFSPTPLILTLLGVTMLPTNTAVALVPKVDITGFVSITTSSEEFYKGKECQPTSVKFTAQAANPANTAFVLLFVRFKSKQTGVTSEWTDSIAMQSIGAGTYVHDLIPLEMKAVDSFQNAWVEYQIVATDGEKQVGKTAIFSERLALLDCVSTPTPFISVAPVTSTPPVQ